jgi:hypothetical protein
MGILDKLTGGGKNSGDENENENEQKSKSKNDFTACKEIEIDGEKVIVPAFIAHNFKQAIKNQNKK